MTQSREQTIINILLIICLILGIITLILFIIPDKVAITGHDIPQGDTSLPLLRDIVPALPQTTIQKKQPSITLRLNPDRTIQSTSKNNHHAITPSPKKISPNQINHHASKLSTLGKKKTYANWMRHPTVLKQDIQFWIDIYSKYTGNHVVLHHPRYLHIIYDIVDLTDIDQNNRLSDLEKEFQKEKRVDNRRDEIEDILITISSGTPNRYLTDYAFTIKEMFAKTSEKDAILNAHKKHGIRAQYGQRDKFKNALQLSGAYLGEIESIFDQYKLPKEITRLIFVESMFQVKAQSSVGAAGLWQFMRSTGKQYLTINRFVDERFNPIESTHAAAKLLRYNYNTIGSWPLAINAYNTGLGRMKQAVKKLGTKNISTIVRRFKHRNYGFASRNFFLEFLAAHHVAENYHKYFAAISFNTPMNFDELLLERHISVPHTIALTNHSLDEFQALNPQLTDAVISGKFLLPMGYSIFVP